MKNQSPSQLVLQSSEDEDSADAKAIHAQLRDHISAEAGPSNRRALIISARLKTDVMLIGGLKGFSHWSWLYISHLWVAEANRSQNIGQMLIDAAIAEARLRQLHGLYVDTFSAKARDFYLRCGFKEFGKLADFPPGQNRYFLSRQLYEPTRSLLDNTD